MNGRNIFIFGATSAIAGATARLYAAEGAAFFLVARQEQNLRAVADDLRARGATNVDVACSHARAFDDHRRIVDQAFQRLGGLDLALIAHGTLADQQACESSFDTLREEFEVNALGVFSLLTHLANGFQLQGHGTLAVISSVAGDRGRQSNYAYGAAKGAVTVFLQGLRNRLYPSGVHVLTVKPGFVDTPMTDRFSKGILWAKPESVARGIYRAVKKKKSVVYLPGFWRLIMAVLCAIPESIFRRMRL